MTEQKPAAVAIREKARSYRKIGVLGLGYVGLPTALLFARHGFDVFGIDISEKALRTVSEGRVGEYYPELAPWWVEVQAQEKSRLRVGQKPEPCDVFLITVPTPVHHDSKTCDLGAVRAAAEAITPVLQKDNIVVLESTVPPGTTRNVVAPILEKSGLVAGKDFHLCFSPERILPGNTIEELVNNHRVLGSAVPESAELTKAILQNVVKGEIYLTDDMTAEFCKLAENTYRDVNIALANELSILADGYGIEMREAIRLINMHPRVKLLTPGIGVGGHCIAVDPWFFVEDSPDKTHLIATSRQVNDRMPFYCAEKIIKEVADLKNPKIACVGLTYKPDVGDTRESPAVRIVEFLRYKKFDVVAFDPLLEEYAGQTLYDAIKGCDYLAVLVNHSVVSEELILNRAKIEAVMRTPRIRVF